MPKQSNLIFAPIFQGLIIEKIINYLTARNRDLMISTDKIKEGICAGLVNGLFEDVFYHAMHPLYSNQNKYFYDADVKYAVENYFSKIQSIIFTDAKHLNSKETEDKLAKQSQPEWKAANNKLQAAIDSIDRSEDSENANAMMLSEKDREKFNEQFKELYVSNSKPIERINPFLFKEFDKRDENEDYFIFLVNLAEKNQVLTSDEALILRENYIPDIPYFESFIARAFHHQVHVLEKVMDQPIKQTELDKLFAHLHVDSSNLSIPMLEFKKSLILDKNDFITQLKDYLQPERLVQLVFSAHIVGIVNTGLSYVYYEPNMENFKDIFCDSIHAVIVNLCLSSIDLALASQVDKDHALIEKKNRFFQCLDKLQNAKNDEERELIFSSVIEDIPPILAARIQCYTYPEAATYQYPQNKSIEDISALSYFVNIIKGEYPSDECKNIFQNQDDDFRGYYLIKAVCKKPYSQEQYNFIKLILESGALNECHPNLSVDLLKDVYDSDNSAIFNLLLNFGANIMTVNDIRSSLFELACNELDNPVKREMLEGMMRFSDKTLLAKSLNFGLISNLIQANMDVSFLIPALKELAAINNTRYTTSSNRCLMLYNNKNILVETTLAGKLGRLFKNFLKDDAPTFFNQGEGLVKSVREITKHLLSKKHIDDTPDEISEFLQSYEVILGSSELKDRYDFSRFLIFLERRKSAQKNEITPRNSL